MAGLDPLKPAADTLFAYLRDVIYDYPRAKLDVSRLPEAFADFGQGLQYFGAMLSEMRDFAQELSMGNLQCRPPSRDNEIAAPLKMMHASLRHLAWQTQQVAKGDYNQRVDFMGEFADAFNEMTKQLELRTNNLQRMIDEKTKSVVELKNAILKTMAELVEYRDDVTGGHIERTQRYLGILIDAMLARGVYAEEMASWDIKLVSQSAQLHDLGKIAVKDSILLKPGKLTDEEFESIKQHSVVGEEIIEKIITETTEREFLEHAKLFAGTHHEKWDGSGYPRGLKGAEIPLQGRIMAIADVYDALVSNRPYKKAFTHEEASNIISESRGTHFDPALVDIFLSVSDEFEKIALFYT
ncbi:MAG: HD domain-containing protein [Chitinispirillales bacterium]|jgi:response regulator RpfG family c-di-GMP phosphodiesterase|nr:HD domain-containing protein [Chitinispirillales bacterium]